MDIVTPRKRSEMMRGIGRKDTKPELVVRRYLHRLGFRYRLHAKDLPGRPDIVFRSFKTVVFVHGCFWHRHTGCKLAYTPKSRPEFWERKFQENVARDSRVQAELRDMGWRVVVIWECAVRRGELSELGETLAGFREEA